MRLERGQGVTFAPAAMVWDKDRTGQLVQVPRPLVGVEKHVAWADTRRIRQRLDNTLAQAIEDVARRHRADVWRSLQDGWQPGEYDGVLAQWVPSYERAIEGYTRSMGRAVEQWAADEARSQARSNDTPSQPGSRVAAMEVAQSVTATADRLQDRVAQGVGMSARQIASRVQSEVSDAWRNGERASTWKSAIAAASLAAPARAVGQVVESEGRMLGAASLQSSGRAAELGVQLVAVVRTSVNDQRRCPICKDLDGTRFDLPRQMFAFENMPLPDPNCLGGTRWCRCGWLMVWARVDR